MTREEVRQEPYPLPKDFEWTTLDINDPKQVFLQNHLGLACYLPTLACRTKKFTICYPSTM
jgi:hypothetical protein